MSVGIPLVTGGCVLGVGGDSLQPVGAGMVGVVEAGGCGAQFPVEDVAGTIVTVDLIAGGIGAGFAPMPAGEPPESVVADQFGGAGESAQLAADGVGVTREGDLVSQCLGKMVAGAGSEARYCTGVVNRT